ncbi:hypothetical protein CACET_c29460 [Clostridium aceticum]|uniref:Uncharacterized protein n=1 Tax=Clostridium aceticum TaxID=84022 RepID=A0A0D8ICP5_9CLOT|nr:hypothetical protein [Clostridium aceticum]AKL96390.1 hypothetical protein CACET_c29460 [Clostridium aceticum]KJF26966.1 Tat pathway signal protein [Clostridium aceticum]
MVNMNITRDHVTGFMVGVGVCAAGYYVYKKNQAKVDDFLRQQGIEMNPSKTLSYHDMTLEELVFEKERIEDLIAEKEIGQNNQIAQSTNQAVQSA